MPGYQKAEPHVANHGDREGGCAGGDQHGQQHHHRPAPEVRDEEHQAAIEPIRDDPGRHRQDHVRNHPNGPEQPDERRVAGLAVDDHEDRDDVEPVADPADELTEEELGQWPVGQELPVDAEAGHSFGC